MTKMDIVSGTVVERTEEGILILVEKWQDKGFCSWANLTEFAENIDSLAEIGSVKKFCLVQNKDGSDQILLSYKYIHPEEQAHKNKIIPTANHFYNLHHQLKRSLSMESEPKTSSSFDAPKTLSFVNLL